MEKIGKDVKNILRKVIEDVKKIRAETDQAQRKIDSGDFSVDFIDRELRPIINANRTKTRSVLTAGFNSVQQALRRFQAESWQANRLRGDELTPDAQLFTLGIRLPVEELEGIFDRAAGNRTMQRLVHMYARSQKIVLNRPMVANLDDDKVLARDLGAAADIFLTNWADNARAEEMLDKFFPEDDGASGAKG